MKNFLNFAIILIAFTSYSQNFLNRFKSIDIQNYKLAIEVNDTNNSINATIDVSLKFKKYTPEFTLDFIKKDSSGTGMEISTILQDNKTVNYFHQNNKLVISSKTINTDSVFTYTINYKGIPKDGLIISNNLN